MVEFSWSVQQHATEEKELLSEKKKKNFLSFVQFVKCVCVPYTALKLTYKIHFY